MDSELKKVNDILRTAKSIAVLGFSRDSYKTSRQIAETLVKKGYKVYGVNPNLPKGNIDGIDVYPSLLDIKEPIDIVNVYRRSEDIPEIISDVLKINPKVLWLQQDIRNDRAVKPVIDSGITVFQDMCIAVYCSLCGI